ncbi:hypothetical protein ACOSQ4_031537 [Xanthoceras sorbifolium]
MVLCDPTIGQVVTEVVSEADFRAMVVSEAGNETLLMGVDKGKAVENERNRSNIRPDNLLLTGPIGAKGENVDIDRPKVILGHAAVVTWATESSPMKGVSVDPNPITYSVKKWMKVARNEQTEVKEKRIKNS